jgi:hypothetical protein
MDYFAGLDVSVKETSVCIVDDTGKIVREVKVASEPKASLGGRVPASISCAPIASASFQDPSQRFEQGSRVGRYQNWIDGHLVK